MRTVKFISANGKEFSLPQKSVAYIDGKKSSYGGLRKYLPSSLRTGL